MITAILVVALIAVALMLVGTLYQIYQGGSIAIVHICCDNVGLWVRTLGLIVTEIINTNRS